MDGNASYYTIKLKDKLQNERESLTPDEFAKLYLENSDVFRSFGDTVLSLMNNKLGTSYDQKTGWEVFSDMVKKSGMSDEFRLKEDWKQWFKGSRPVFSSDTGRKKVFQIAFALKLTKKETEDFIRKSCFCRPIDYRNIIDCVCYYCIKNERTWEDASSLLERINETNNNNECSTNSKILKDTWENIGSDDDLIGYCSKLCGKNQRLEEAVQSLLDDYTNGDDQNGIKSLKNLIKDDKEQIKRKKTELDEYFGGGIKTDEYDTDSIQTLINIIVGFSFGRGRTDSITATMNNVLSRITENFPSGNILLFNGRNRPNADCLRKTLILLETYKYWRTIENTSLSSNDAQYVYLSAINDRLIDCGVQELYWGDPFDALMLSSAYSSGDEDPIEYFRLIMDKLRNTEHRERQLRQERSNAKNAGEKATEKVKKTVKPEKIVWKNDSNFHVKEEWKEDWVQDQSENDDIYKDGDETLKELWENGHPHYKSGSDAEKELLRLMREEHCKNARDELVRSYYRYVICWAKRYMIPYLLPEYTISGFISDCMDKIISSIHEYEPGEAILSTFLTSKIKYINLKAKEESNRERRWIVDLSPSQDDDAEGVDDDAEGVDDNAEGVERSADPDVDVVKKVIDKETVKETKELIKNCLDSLAEVDKDILCCEYGLSGQAKCSSAKALSDALKEKYGHEFDEKDIHDAEMRLIRIMSRNPDLKKLFTR